MLYPAKALLHFLMASKNQYGVHSPFLFDYLTKGLKDQGTIKLDSVESLRKELEQNDLDIEVTDFGAGSKVFRTNKRSISKIASNAGISKKRGKLLAKTVAYFKPGQILEIGSSLGMSTCYMAIGNPEAQITTLEGCPEIAKIAKENYLQLGFKNISMVVGAFEKTLDAIIKDQTFDLIYFDGNHQKEPTIDYFEKCLKASHEDSVFIFDDIHWTEEMERAWDYIRNHKKVTLSVDTYKWGLVFFHTGRVKEHFTLRI